MNSSITDNTDSAIVHEQISQSQLDGLKKDYPEIYRIFLEAENERVMYKVNEYAYRRYMQKEIVNYMEQYIPKNLSCEMALLYKAKSFISGDFCYAAKYVEDKYLIWVGDSISHGTGSSIVKNIINDTVQTAFTLFRNKKNYSLPALVHRIQNTFSSPKGLKKILDANLSDIITGNEYYSKLAIVVPIVFIQMERIEGYTRVRICNRGMPGVIIIRPDQETGKVEKVFFFTKSETVNYEGKYRKLLEVTDYSGVPLILDREIFTEYAVKTLVKVNKPYTETNVTNEVFKVHDFYAKNGDMIVVPSDGITEIVNRDGEEYGVSRFIDSLVDFINDNKKFDSFDTFKEEYYIEQLRKYTVWDEKYSLSGNGIEDDMTLLFLRIT
jgi:hypothetical protein